MFNCTHRVEPTRAHGKGVNGRGWAGSCSRMERLTKGITAKTKLMGKERTRVEKRSIKVNFLGVSDMATVF